MDIADDELPSTPASDSNNGAEPPQKLDVADDGDRFEDSDVSNRAVDPKSDRYIPKATEVIRASAAVDLLEPLILGRAQTKRELVDLARDGRLTCYALRYWTEKLDNPAAVWRHPGWRTQPQDDMERKVKIPRRLWLKADNLQDECLQWDWRRGRCYLRETLKSGRTKIHFIKGLWMLEEEVMELKFALNGSKKIDARSGRKITKISEWTQFWTEIAVLADSGQIRSISGNRTSKLIGLLKQRFKKQGALWPNLSEDVTTKAAAAVLAQIPFQGSASKEDEHWTDRPKP